MRDEAPSLFSMRLTPAGCGTSASPAGLSLEDEEELDDELLLEALDEADELLLEAFDGEDELLPLVDGLPAGLIPLPST